MFFQLIIYYSLCSRPCLVVRGNGNDDVKLPWPLEIYYNIEEIHVCIYMHLCTYPYTLISIYVICQI